MKAIYSVAILTAVLVFTACKKDHNPSPEKPKHVYATATLNLRAAYMIDDSVYYLTPPSTGVLPSGYSYGGIFIKNDTVYVAGMVPGASQFDNYKAVYWKNGVQTVIADNTGSSYFLPRDIIVNAANEVIVAGVVWESGIPNRAAFWKNGVLTPIGPSGVNSQSYAMAITGNDVYICGYIHDAATNKDVATLWKNGTIVFQHNGTNETSAQDILIAGSDIYLSGWEYNNATNKGRAVYWKNGSFTPVSDAARDEYNEGGMAVSGTDVYLLSNEYLPGTTGSTTIVRYYKNGTPVQLSTGTDLKYAETLAVFNGKVYAGGWKNNGGNDHQAILWKDGVLTTFPSARDSKIHRIRVF
jgi:hypothetical protein